MSRLDAEHVVRESHATTVRCRVAHTLHLATGLAVCAIGTAVAVGVNYIAPAVSAMLVAIVLGAIYANTVGVPTRAQPGLRFAAKRLLRIGVALLGLQLVLGDIMALGYGVIVLIVAVVVLGILGTLWAGGKLGMSLPQRLLIACGFSICGAAAVAAVSSVSDADEEDTAAAVALVVVFGTLMIPIIPALSYLLGLDQHSAGVWAGAAIHEVAQVVAAGGAIGGTALAVAVVVKLGRVLLLAPVIAVLSYRKRRRADSAPGDVQSPPLVPLFVISFLGFVTLRSTGVVPAAVLDTVRVVQTILLAMAMFALGAGVKIAAFRSSGLRPFILAAASTVLVAGTALAGIVIFDTAG